MRNKFGTLFMFLGVALIWGALALSLHNQQEARNAGEQSDALLQKLVEQIDAQKQSDGIEWIGKTEEAETYLPMPQIPEELLTAEDVKMTEVVIDGQSYIGYLSIPALNLELPILSDWSYTLLKIAPCRYDGTVRGNDLVLFAHNFDRHFGRLKKLSEGDSVYFTDMDGNTTAYEVVAQDILDPYAVEEMTAGVYDLTLFTCTYGGKSRVTIYCNRIP